MRQLSFQERVKEAFPRLSAGQKKVAVYLVENVAEAAFLTAFQMGQQAEVSETTVIRFSYALGFEGFSDMQACIQKQLLRHRQEAECEEADRLPAADPFTRVIESEIHILRHLLDSANVQDIWRAVDALIRADQVLIAGHRISYAAAYWFSHTLSSLRGQVSLCAPTGDFLERLCNVTEQSVVVMFSFPRYATEMVKMAECVKAQGICLIAVTDRVLSPVGRIADIALTTEERAGAGNNSLASVISLLELVIAGMYERDQKRIQAYQQRLEQLYAGYEVFAE